MASSRTALGVVLILIAALIGVLLWTGTRTQSSSAEDLPDISLEEFETKLASLEGDKPVVLNFWASWCPPCRAEAGDLEKAWQQYKDRVEFIGIDIQNDTVDAALDFMDEFNVTYPQVRDSSGRIGTTYKLSGVPETFLITKDGEQADHILGATTFEKLSTSIEEKLLE
ncbi:MAG: TlpA family protein disulfide reductase [Terriglobia bacterium]